MNFSTYQENNSAESERNSFGYSATQQADPAVHAAQLPMQGSVHPLQQPAPAQAPPYGYPTIQHPLQGSTYPMQNLYAHFQDPQSQQPPVLQPGLFQPPDGLDAYQMQQITQAQAMPYIQPHPQIFSGVTPMYLPPQQPIGMPMHQPAMPQQFFAPQQYAIPMLHGPFGTMLVPTELAPTLQKEAQGVPAETVPTLERVPNQSNASSESGASPELAPKKDPTPPPKQQLPSRKRSPPGFETSTLKDKRVMELVLQDKREQKKIKQSVPVNYAKAAKSNKRDPAKQSEPALRNSRNPRNSGRSERQVRPPRKQNSSKPRNQSAPQQRKPKKKFGYRSKQNKINEIFNALCQKYGDMGILAGHDEVLRGETTIRLHVKKYKALNRIQEALLAVENKPWITIDKISIPMSMKNQFQKKGFLVYCRVAELSMVDEAKRIFQSFDEFKKCEVARQTNPVAKLAAQRAQPSGPDLLPAAFDELEDKLARTHASGSPPRDLAVSESIDFLDIEAANAANKAWHANAAKKADRVEQDSASSCGDPRQIADSDWDDSFCGSVDACGLVEVEAVAPELNDPVEADPLPEENNAEENDFAFADKMMLAGGDCGLLDDLDLGPPGMCPRLSHGEAGL